MSRPEPRPAAVVPHARIRQDRLSEADRGIPRALAGAGAGDCRRSSQLPYTIDVANDPFFGRVGQIMAVSQRQQALKFELLIPYHERAAPTACMSFNYHREHFGECLGHQRCGGEARAHELRRLRNRSAGGRVVRQSTGWIWADGRRRPGRHWHSDPLPLDSRVKRFPTRWPQATRRARSTRA